MKRDFTNDCWRSPPPKCRWFNQVNPESKDPVQSRVLFVVNLEEPPRGATLLSCRQ